MIVIVFLYGKHQEGCSGASGLDFDEGGKREKYEIYHRKWRSSTINIFWNISGSTSVSRRTRNGFSLCWSQSMSGSGKVGVGSLGDIAALSS